MSEQKSEFHTRDRWLVFAFVLGPLAALSHLSVTYILVPSACEAGSKAMLHASTAVFLLLAGGAALLAWKIHTAFREPEGVLWRERTRWLSLVTVVLAISSMTVIVAMQIPNWILRSCD